MSGTNYQSPWYLWPFVALWGLVAGIVKVTGRLIAMLIGLVLMIAGVALTATIVGAVIGIPLIILGFTLAVRGLF